MRIGFYGGMVNNMYTMFKAATRLGYSAYYIRDREDSYPAHQPFWLDAKIFWETSEKSAVSCKLDWEKYEEIINWKRPHCYLDPLDYKNIKLNKKNKLQHIRNLILRAFFSRRLERNPIWSCNLMAMQQVDIIIVCGFNSILNACASGKPFFIWSHGGDIRFTLGLESRPKGIRNQIYDYMTRAMLRYAFAHSQGVLSNDPTSTYIKGTPSVTKSKNSIPQKKNFVLPLPSYKNKLDQFDPIFKIKGTDVERMKLDVLFEDNANNYLKIFIPSRFDIKWKGQDRFLEALSKLKCKNAFRVYITAYGCDIDFLKQIIASYRLERVVNIIPGILSRPLLFDMYKKCDLVVDQFNIGTFGAVTMEALSLSVPVIAYINKSEFENHSEMMPPIFNCKSVLEIKKVLKNLSKNTSLLKEEKKRIEQWYQKTLEDDVFKKNIDNILNIFLKND